MIAPEEMCRLFSSLPLQTKCFSQAGSIYGLSKVCGCVPPPLLRTKALSAFGRGQAITAVSEIAPFHEGPSSLLG